MNTDIAAMIGAVYAVLNGIVEIIRYFKNKK